MKGYIGGASSIYRRETKNTCKIVGVENKSRGQRVDGREILVMGLQVVE
jgi:hypothetical protein